MPRPKKRSSNKSAFVRKHIDLPVDEIISKAKAAGMTLSAPLIYKVRGRAKSSTGSSTSTSSSTKSSAGSIGTSAKPKAALSAPPKPAGRVGRPPSALSKAGFIRSQPATLSAREVVEAAAARGIRITANHVHAVRAASKKSGASLAIPASSASASTASLASASAPSTIGRRPGRPRKNPIANVASASNGTSASHASNGGGESIFRKLVVELGVSRAKALVTEVERKLAALVAGM